MIDYLPSHASDQSLDVSVGPWSPVRGEHDLDAFGREDRIEAARVLRVAVAKKEADAEIGLVVEIHDHVACLLVTQVPFGLALTPTPRIRRVSMCRNTSAYKVLRNTVSTVKKSQATMALACEARNWRQVGSSRRGAGPRPARRRMVRIVVAETTIPKPWSSPLIRTHPQRGLSLAMRTIRDLVSASMGGRPCARQCW